MLASQPLEMKTAIIAVALFPYLVSFVLYRLRRFPNHISSVALVLSMFVAIFVVITLIRSELFTYPSGTFTLLFLLWYPAAVTAIAFPGLPLAILLTLSAVLVWKRVRTRVVLLGLSALAHLLFAVNIIMFIFDVPLMNV